MTANLKREFAQHGRGLGEVRRTLEKWHIFANPYKRLEYAVHTAAEELEGIELLAAPRLPVEFDSEESYTSAIETVRDYTSRIHRSSSLALTIRYLAPVLAEAFVNLVIFVCARPEIRDKSVYDSVIREHISTRVQRLHETCSGFRKPIDPRAGPYKDFLRLMDYRNHLLHGNVDPARSTFDIVFFDRNRPIFPEEDNLALRLPRKSTEWITPAAALLDVEVVESFVEFIWDHMDPEPLESLIAVMGEGQPGWRPDTGRVGMLFPSQIVFGLGFGKRDGASAEPAV